MEAIIVILLAPLIIAVGAAWLIVSLMFAGWVLKKTGVLSWFNKGLDVVDE